MFLIIHFDNAFFSPWGLGFAMETLVFCS